MLLLNMRIFLCYLQQLTDVFDGMCFGQRCRYIEAHAVHKKLSELEDLWEGRNIDEGKLSRVRMARKQRNRIVVSAFSSHVWHSTGCRCVQQMYVTTVWGPGRLLAPGS